MNHKKDYEKDGIKDIQCEIFYEQDIESELFNNIPLYAKEQERHSPEKKMMQTIGAALAKQHTQIIRGSLMDKINQKPLVDLVLEYT